MLIVYCDVCGFRIADDEVQSGKAVKLDEDRYACSKCAPAKTPARPPSGGAPAAARMPTGATAVVARPKSGAVRPARNEGAPPPAEGSEGSEPRPQPAPAKKALLAALGGGASVLVLAGLIYALSGKNDSTKNGSTAATSGGQTQAAKTSGETPAAEPAGGADPIREAMEEVRRKRAAEAANAAAQTAPSTPQDRAKSADQELENMRALRAAGLLDELKKFIQQNPADPWGAKEKADVLINGYRSTPSAEEARAILATLKLDGERPANRANWHLDWAPSGREGDTRFLANYDGRANVYVSHPLEGDQPGVLARSWVVPADRPFLEVSMRANPDGDHRMELWVAGAKMLDATQSGANWRTYAIDLNALKGREVAVAFIHWATGWKAEHCYLQAPRFVAQPPADATLLVWDPAQAAERSKHQPELKNPGFENARWEGWYAWGGFAYANAPQPHGGTGAVQLPPGRSGLGQRVNGLVPGKRYILRGWVRSGKAGASVRFGIKEHGAPEVARSVSSNTWTQVELPFTMGFGEYRPQVFLYKDSGDHTAALDDVELVAEGGEPALRLAAQPAQSGTAAINPLDAAVWANAVDLLALMKPDRDMVLGKWTLNNGQLLTNDTTKGQRNRVRFPYAPGREYALRVTFTRKSGNNTLTLIAPNGSGGGAMGMLQGWNKYAGFDLIDDIRLDKQSSRKEGNFIKNGSRQTALLWMTSNGPRLYLDNKLLSELNTDFTNVKIPPDWGLEDPRLPGLGTFESEFQIFSAQLLDIAGTGRPVDPAPLGSAPPAPVETAAAGTVPVAAPAGHPGGYAALSGDVFALLARGAVLPAREKIQKAMAEKDLAAHRPALELDLTCVALVERAEKAVEAGVEALRDKRVFAFVPREGPPLNTGRGTPNSVLGLKDGLVQIKMSLDGGKITAKKTVALSQLNAATLLELQRIGLSTAPDGDAVFALLGILSHFGEGPAVRVRELHTRAAAAGKVPATAALSPHLEAWIQRIEKSEGAEAALKELENLHKSKKNEGLSGKLDALVAEHAGAPALLKLKDRITALREGLERARIVPGLSVAYFSGDDKNQFSTFIEAETWAKELQGNWGNGSPKPSVPSDFFGVRWKGFLRIPEDGTYEFQLSSDDNGWLWIDGNLILKRIYRVTESVVNTKLELSRGDHAFQLDYSELGGGGALNFTWKTPGKDKFVPIPAAVLFHDQSEPPEVSAAETAGAAAKAAPAPGENIALRRSVKASSVYQNKRQYQPDKLVDGDEATLWASGADASSWVLIDLGAPVKLAAIELVARKDGDYPDHADDLAVAVGDDPDGKDAKTVFDTGKAGITKDKPCRIELPPNTTARFIRISAPKGGAFSEVRAFAPK